MPAHEVRRMAHGDPQTQAHRQRRADAHRAAEHQRQEHAECRGDGEHHPRVAEQRHGRPPPAGDRRKGEERRQNERQRHEHAVVVRRTVGRLLATRGGLVGQRVQGVEQHHGQRQHQYDVVDQKQEFPRHTPVLDARANHGGAQGVERQCAADGEHQQPEDEQAALGIDGEGVHRGQDTRADDEGAEQGQRERRDGEKHGPALERAPLLGDRQGVDECRAGEPRHERRVLDRIPEPPTAPAEFVVGPPASQGDTDGEERPGDVGPGPGPARPGRVQPAREQRRHGERERHRETHVAQVKHGGMNDLAEVLEQRIEVGPLRRSAHQALERTADAEQEKQKTRVEQAQRAQDTAVDFAGHAATGHGDQPGPHGEHQRP